MNKAAGVRAWVGRRLLNLRARLAGDDGTRGFRGLAQWVIEEMGISVGGRRLGVAEQLTDNRQGEASGS